MARVRKLHAAHETYKLVEVEYALAQALSDYGSFDLAMQILLERHRDYPDEPNLRIESGELLVQLYGARGDHSRAYALLDRLANACGKHDLADRAGLHGVRAELDYQNGLLEKAAAELAAEWKLAEDSKDPQARTNALLRQAEYRIATGQWRRAKETATQLLEVDGNEIITKAATQAIAAVISGFADYVAALTNPEAGKALAQTKTTLRRALADPHLPVAWRPLVSIKLFKTALEAGDLAEAARQRDAFEALADERHPKYALWAALSARMAREEKAPKEALREHQARLDSILEGMLANWRAIASREGGLGFLHLTERRIPLEELIELWLCSENEAEGIEGALDAVLRVQALNSIALARGAGGCDTAAVREQLVRKGHGVAVYVRGARETFLFLLDSEGTDVFRLGAPESLVGSTRDFSRALALDPRDVRKDPEATNRLRKLGATAADLLLPEENGIRARVLGWSSATIVGTEQLHRVPIGALPMDDELLGERLPITEVASLPLALALLPREAEEAGPPLRMSLVACVSTEAEEAQEKEIEAAEFPEEAVRRLLDTYGEEHTDALVDDEATLAAVRNLDLAGSDVTHILAHHLRDLRVELGAGLALHDAALWHDELRQLEVGGLVVLSACASGRGAERAGDSPLATTLAGAFLRQGAHTVVQSLAPIELASHLELMLVFHELLESGGSPAQALQEARQQLATAPWITRFYRAQIQVHGRGDRALR